MPPEKRPRRETKTVAVVVPCTAKHVGHVPELLKAYENQTRLPNEVILTLSGSPTSPQFQSSRFRVTILHDPRPKNAAENRNRAAPHVTADVVIYQDADDVPHAQRVELIGAAFETFAIDHLMHRFECEPQTSTWRLSRNAVHTAMALCRAQPIYKSELWLTNGNPAVSRTLLSLVSWPGDRRIGEDIAFNTSACRVSRGRNVILPLPLLLYRQRLSATNNR